MAWSPDGHSLSSSSRDKTIRIWDTESWKTLAILGDHNSFVRDIAWSPNGQFLASGSDDNIIIWHSETWQKHIGFMFKREKGKLFGFVNWASDSERLFIGYVNSTLLEIWNAINGIKIHALYLPSEHVCELSRKLNSSIIAIANNKEILLLDTDTYQTRNTIEGHTDLLISLGFSSTGQILATKSLDNTIRLWNSNTWEQISNLNERASRSGFSSLAFHPRFSVLATLGAKETVIRIWDIDTDVLLGQAATESVRYTSAKLVLVGDSGVGKTGLGWRLTHGEFKEHASTHGQQFWVINELGKKRADGTECEAVLWDLAGQHVYRPIHSIFLEHVDAALVLFDPSNRQASLKGAQFWLEQLKGKAKLPPVVLVGARVDRGAPVISQQELEQYCQQHGISGGYISTSAATGEGLEQLLEILKEQIPWEKMTTTVTTVTFKRIKEYVLALKEQADRWNVLVEPEELREQLQSAWDQKLSPFESIQNTKQDDAEQWEFTNAEMMTAVGHLETHGYVTILQSSSGKQYILLTPDLLVDLASSIVLLADKHPRELGAVNEIELLQGAYLFDELKALEPVEQEVLLDAAVLRFLEHNVCFRETLYDDTLLIFPGLIKQKRPLDDDFPAADDVSYVVRGCVENLYAMLVVLLGYTPTFIRINQWQNQAQYEMGKGEICGFRMIADREGEIELVLYYAEQMPQNGRDMFQQFFEQFLYQREVEVTRIPTVFCTNGHCQERATIIKRLRDGKDFAFCDECGDRIDLPAFESPTIGTSASPWLQQEEAIARLRSLYETHLTRVKGYRRGWAMPRCYLSRVPGQEDCAEKLIHDLQDAGIYLVEHVADVQPNDYVIMLDTPDYQQAWNQSSDFLTDDKTLIQARMADNNHRLISLKLQEKPRSAVSHDLDHCVPGDFCDVTHYPVSLFNLVLNLYAIPLTHAVFLPLRKSLHQQWERMPAGTDERPSETGKRFEIALSFPGEYRDFVKAVADKLSGEVGRERVFYDAYYEAELARPNMDTYLQKLYHDQTELIVVFLCAEYEQKEWCGLEWRAVRDLLRI